MQSRATKRLLHQLHQHQPLASDIEHSDDDGYDEITFHVSYRRPELVHNKTKLDNSDLSEHVKFRLWLARQLALAKYQEKWV
jgi:hypothetical protein